MHLSESLAAVTLLALANGAGDVITALVAGGAAGGVSYNIGALYGAGLFVAAIVVSICIFQSSEPMIYDKSIIHRDIGVYIVSTITIIIFGIVAQITWYEACILLALYVVLVLIVVIQEKVEASREKKAAEVEALKDALKLDDDEKKMLVDDDANPQMDEERKNIEKANLMKGLFANIQTDKDGNAHPIDSKDLITAIFSKVGIGHFLKEKKILITEQKEKTFQELSCYEKVMKCISAPWEFLLYCTVPPVVEEEYSFQRLMVWPIPGVYLFFMVFTKTFYSWAHLYIGLPIVAAIYIVFLLTLNKETPPKWFMVFTCIGVIDGLMYTYLLIGILVDLLNTIGILLCLDNTYLGLTILAVGNALPDAFTTIALVKKGAGTMAISGGYAGQLFGLLVGFGLSMLKLTLMTGPQSFNLFDMSALDQNLLPLIVIGTSFAVLVTTYLWGVLNNYSMNKPFATVMCSMYGAFFIACTVIAVKKAALEY